MDADARDDGTPLSAEEIADRLGLAPMATEAILYRRTYEAPPVPDGSRPSASAIVCLLTAAPDSFSDLHRLPQDELWHFHLGDAIELLLLRTDGSDELVRLGPDLRAGDVVQQLVPAGTWFGARLSPGGRHAWGVFGCTLTPGYVLADFEGADADELVARWPQRAVEIRSLTRPGMPKRFS